jgi:predicted DNA-binding transcriptional regulator AlpA
MSHRLPPGLLDPRGVASVTGLTLATVHQYTARGVLPPPDFRLGRVPVWQEGTIRGWMRRREG